MKTLSLKLPELLLEQITSFARERGESRSSLVRKAIEALINGNHHQHEASCLDMANDLAGSVDGLEDLSFNKKHLRSYGQ